MALSGTDAYGTYLDTGIGTAVTPRAGVEEEFHVVGEIDTASKNTVAVTVASHIAHRDKKSPR